MPDKRAKTLKSTSDAVEILHRRFYEGKPARLKNLEEARANEEIARKIQGLRAAAASPKLSLPSSPALPVWSKYSCGSAVVFEQPTQAFSAPDCAPPPTPAVVLGREQ